MTLDVPAGDRPRPGPRWPYVLRWLRAETRLTVLAVWRGILGIFHSDDLTFASSIAYYSLLSLFPFFLCVFAVLGRVTADIGDRTAILNFVLRYFPRQFPFVTDQLDALQQAGLRLGLVGTLLTIWAAMGVFSAVTTAINHAWGVERQPNYFRHKLIAFFMLVAASLLLLLGLLLVSAINIVEARWFADVLMRVPGLVILRHLVVKWTTTMVFVLVVGLIFYFVPNAKVRFRDVWVGAIVTGLLWRGALYGFSFYVRDLHRFSVHGSIAAVVVFLVWVYTSAVILLFGVEITAANARIRRSRPDRSPAAPSPRT